MDAITSFRVPFASWWAADYQHSFDLLVPTLLLLCAVDDDDDDGGDDDDDGGRVCAACSCCWHWCSF